MSVKCARLFILFFLFICSYYANYVISDSTELLENGGCENGLTGWETLRYIEHQEFVKITNSKAAHGSYSLLIPTEAHMDSWISGVSQTIELNQVSNLNLSFFVFPQIDTSQDKTSDFAIIINCQAEYGNSSMVYFKERALTESELYKLFPDNSLSVTFVQVRSYYISEVKPNTWNRIEMDLSGDFISAYRGFNFESVQKVSIVLIALSDAFDFGKVPGNVYWDDISLRAISTSETDSTITTTETTTSTQTPTNTATTDAIPSTKQTQTKKETSLSNTSTKTMVPPTFTEKTDYIPYYIIAGAIMIAGVSVALAIYRK